MHTAFTVCLLNMTYLEERRGNSVNKLGDLSRHGLHGTRQLDDLVAVRAANPAIDLLEHVGLPVSILLAPRIVEVVGVNHTHDVVELVGPARAVVVPVEVLRLLERRTEKRFC